MARIAPAINPFARAHKQSISNKLHARFFNSKKKKLNENLLEEEEVVGLNEGSQCVARRGIFFFFFLFEGNTIAIKRKKNKKC